MQGNKPGIVQVIRNAIWNPSYTNDAKKVEERSNFNFSSWGELITWMNGEQKDADSGESITERSGHRLDTVFNCINVISQDVGKTESPVKKSVDGFKKVVDGHPSNYLLNVKANRFMSSYTWKYMMVSHMLGWGNGYSGIIRDENGIDVEYIPLMPWDTSIEIIDGEVFYINKGVAHPSRDILHFKMFTEDGINGISPILWNAKIMGYKIKQDRYSTRAIGVKPPGFVSGDATAEQFEKNIASWNNHMRGENPTGIPYMSGTNVKFNPLMIPPNEGQHLETKQYTDVKICGIYRLNIAKIGFTENIKYSNQENIDINHAKDVLHPIFTMMEQELSDKCFSTDNYSSKSPLYVKFNMWGNIRADLKTRGEFYHTMRTDGNMSGDEIRAQMDMPKMPDGLGETIYIQGAMMPLSTQKDAVLNGGQENPSKESKPIDEERMLEIFETWTEKNGRAKTV